MCTASLLFYAARLSEYGNNLPAEVDSKYLDLTMVIIIPFMYIPYLYATGWGILQTVQWIPLGSEHLAIDFYNAITFFELLDPTTATNYETHLISWSIQYFAGP